MDGSMPAISLPLSLLVSVQSHSKEGGGWIDHAVDTYLDYPASCMNFYFTLFSLKKHGFTHRTPPSQRTERLNFCQVSVSRPMWCNEDLSFDFRRSWIGCMCQILKGIWGWHVQHQRTLKSISPEFTLQMEVPTFLAQQQLILLNFRKLGKS